MTILNEDIKLQQLIKYKSELEEELNAVLSYWMNYTVDKVSGGFYGSVNNKNIPDKSAPKGVVLHSRILWTFSAAFRLTCLLYTSRCV